MEAAQLQVVFEQEAASALVCLERAAIFDAILIAPVVVFNTDKETMRIAVVEIQLKEVEARHVEVKTDAIKQALDIPLTKFIGRRDQHILDWTEAGIDITDFTRTETRREFTVKPIVITVPITVVNKIDEQEGITKAQATGVLKSDSLLLVRISL